MLLEAAARAGWYGLMVRSSGPQIRGGEAAALLRLAARPVDCLDDRFDAVIAVDWQNTYRFADEIPLDAASLMVGDPDQGTPPEVFTKRGVRLAQIPFKRMAKAIPGSWPNMIVLGVAGTLAGLSVETLKSVVRSSYKKGGDGLAASLAAVDAGIAAAEKLPATPRLVSPGRAGKEPRWLITGNEATGYGAVRGGVRFVAAYPITPATEVLEWLAPALADVGGTLVQAEDELASINMAIGASFGGPSTGIPAKSEQSDVSIALNGLHGDAPRIVVAPNSIADCLTATQWAVHLAENLQVPAIVLSDQYFGQTRAVIDRPADVSFIGDRLLAAPLTEAYKRYAVTESCVSPMAIPGTPGVAYTAEGLEHNERGTPSSQSGDHIAQLAKRERKLRQHDYGEYWAEIEGEGDIAVVTFGSCTGPVREALARAAAEGIKARLVSMRLLSPPQPERLAKALEGVKRVLVVEQNHGAQFHRHLRADFDLPGEVLSFHRAGPLPIRPDEVYRRITEWGRA
jgi:2-oxoglutarate ferredoxin oxidoreductase subunit alpha